MNQRAAIDAAVAAAGRVCPVDYTYSPSMLARAPDFTAETLYVVGGLYGNLEALREVERLAAAESATLVFNGDFHWFDAEPDWFAAIESGVAPHRALRGNVESEIARDGDIGAGCGCAYPSSVDEGVVTRSNEILAQLRDNANAAQRARLARLPMHLVAQVGALRVGIVHGDAAALAGWRFAHDALDNPNQRHWLDDIRRRSQIDVFTCTHTCLAALRDFDLPCGRLTVANNGAAGMPNFTGQTFGLLTRIALTPSPHRPLYGMGRDDIFIDAIPIAYDAPAFLGRFEARWGEGSAAALSYRSRIIAGPDYPVSRARLPG
ncbi:MAG: metallophosphoesterase [Pseudolabrys sp.]